MGSPALQPMTRAASNAMSQREFHKHFMHLNVVDVVLIVP